MGKPILCLDFDGVLHSYTSGWKGADNIPDRPVEGAMDFIREAVNHFQVHIFSARSNQEGGIFAMRKWLWKYLISKDPHTEELNMDVYYQIEFPTVKPPAFVSIDDRCLLFTGVFPSMGDLIDFKPWNKKEV